MRVLIRVAWWAGAPVRAALIGLIRLYRVTLGQGLLGGQCRFYPSCSSYAENAIGELGWIRGLGLAIWRIARCNPFNSGGVDYPPRKGAQLARPYDGVNQRAYDTVIHGRELVPDVAAHDEVEGFPRERAPARGEFA